MAQTSVTITWTTGSASASLRVDFVYTISGSDTTWSFKLNSISVDWAGTTGSGADLESAKNKRQKALNSGIPIKFYYRGADIVQGRVSGSVSNVITVGTAYDTRTITKTHAAQSVQFYGVFNSKNGIKYTETIPAKTHYTVTYDGNGAASPAAATKWYGETLQLAAALTRSGYAFQRWNTNTSNTGAGYGAGAAYTNNAAITLYAIWDAYIYYNTNGGSGGPGTVRKTYGSTHTVPSAKPTRNGYVFKCWNTKADGSGTNYYSGTSTYSSNATLTLYAIWNPVLTFNANDGSGTTWTETKTYNSAHPVARTPTRANYQFVGWATSESATAADYAGTIPADVNTSATFYAVWKRIYEPPKLSVTRVFRADANGNADDEGKYASITAAWQISPNIVSNNSLAENYVSANGITASCNGAAESQSAPQADKSGTVTFLLDADMATDASYTAVITLTDQGGSSTVSIIVPMAYFPIDILSLDRGHGVAVGAPATRDDTFEIGFLDTVFALNTNEDLYTALDALGWNSAVEHDTGGVPSFKKILTKILQLINPLKTPTVLFESWSGIATPAAQWYTLATVNIPTGTQYLLLGKNNNGIAGQSLNSITFVVNSGQATTITGNTGANLGTSGNNVIGWQYVKAITDCTIDVRAYGYDTSVTSMIGAVIGIPIGYGS